MKRTRPAFDPPRPKATRKSNVGEQSKKKRGASSSSGNKEAANKSRHGRQTENTLLSGDDDDDAQVDGGDEDTDASVTDNDRSPEPDFILAEISDEPASKAQGDDGLSVPLIQRIIQEHFQGKNTRMTTDARQVVAKYIEIFVREAIMRSAYERTERDKVDGTSGVMSGWLEVEDLERIAPQLCLDF